MTATGLAIGLALWASAYCLLGLAAERNFMVLPALFLVLCFVG